MLNINNYIKDFTLTFPEWAGFTPWHITGNLPELLHQLIARLGKDYHISNGIAIHQIAVVEEGAILKAPVIIGERCFVAAGAYLRGGMWLGAGVVIGSGCEVKSSIIGPHSGIAHFNFIGDSMIGSSVNMEAGAIAANHYNERSDKTITVQVNSTPITTGVQKFGALIGDGCKVGANAVLSPGTVLLPGSIVKRLELVEQNPVQG